MLDCKYVSNIFIYSGMQYNTLHIYTYVSIMPSPLGLYTTLISTLMRIGIIVIYICSHS